MEGEERVYFQNGKLASIAKYKNGEKNGTHKEWNETGTLVFEGEYVGGKRHGKLNKYFDDGKPYLVQTFENDEIHGVKLSYDKEGNVMESRYDHGKRLQ